MSTKRPRLYKQLNAYCASDAYPFHMPGHKRRTDAAFLKDFPHPYGIDITEIDGFDNLHHAEGILKDSMEWAASVYGAKRTYFLVNGSTCGVLAALCAAAASGGSILMARNSHKSAYHAAALHNLNVCYVYPQVIHDFGLQGGLLSEEIEKMLITQAAGGGKPENDRVSAVFVTSPTYDGIVSDIGGIAEVCRRHGSLLIVDEAHGAHLNFGGGMPGACSVPGETFPASALSCGADIVIQSLHKTLPALTQTALLHVAGERVDLEKLEYYLQVFQTSSPSYVLMAGTERCIEYMAAEGRTEMGRFAARIQRLRDALPLHRLRMLDRQVIGQAGVRDLDNSKIVVSTRWTGHAAASGDWLSERLCRVYHLEMEMCGTDYVTAITTLMDTEEGLRRLERALTEIDRELEKKGGRNPESDPVCPPPLPPARAALPLYEAVRRPSRPLEIECSEGRISGEYVYLYPPGIPILAPGEVITGEIIKVICACRGRKLSLQGLRDRMARQICVI